jgi:acyl-CoA synthetase (NDP forming)
LREIGLPCFSSVAGCAHAVAALVRVSQPPVAMTVGDTAAAHRAVHRLIEFSHREGALCEYEAKLVLQELPGLAAAIPPERLATSREHAVAAAHSLGYPVALKVQSRAIAHKAAAGGVALALGDADAVREAYDRVVEAAGTHLDGTHFDGVLVQSMATTGLELLVGVQNRSGLGPIVVVGFGGSLVEIIDRTAMFPAPFDEAIAADLLREIGVDRALGPEFAEFAGSGVADIDRALAPLHRVVAAVSQFAWAARDTLGELDLNPIIVDRSTGAPTIVDALIA